MEVRAIVKDIKDNLSQKSSSLKDEVKVMQAMLNDKGYAVDVYGKDGKTGETYSPSADARNMITSDPSKYYYIDSRGVVHYKAAYDKLSNEDKAEVDNELYSKTRSKAKGGYLTIKRRKRK